MRLTRFVLLAMFAACSAAPSPTSESSTAERTSRTRRIPAIERCETPRDCIVISRTCCGRCGAAVPGDARAVNSVEHRAAASRGEQICEPPAQCPDCYEQTEPTLIATCRRDRCVLVDLSRDEVTACRTPEDCETTYAGCCECGSPGEIALARGRANDYRTMLCGTEPMPCPACAGDPPRAIPTCTAGHCSISTP